MHITSALISLSQYERRIFTLHNKILAEQKRLTQHLQTLKKQINHLPDGQLCCAKNGKHYKWYHSHGKGQVYIPKSNRKFAELLAKKKYLILLAEETTQKLNAINHYLKYYPSGTSPSEKLLTEHPEYSELLSPYFQPKSEELTAWTSASYEQNPFHPEQLIHKTISGHRVRSKSEALIAMSLYTHNIPFRYEAVLQLGAGIVYPDFTIRHPQNGKIIYWEHFGLMDDPGYRQRTVSKLQLYILNGFVPNIHLITTYETREKPLSSDEIERLIEEHFL